jgi:hypothetical protein
MVVKHDSAEDFCFLRYIKLIQVLITAVPTVEDHWLGLYETRKPFRTMPLPRIKPVISI